MIINKPSKREESIRFFVDLIDRISDQLVGKVSADLKSHMENMLLYLDISPDEIITAKLPNPSLSDYISRKTKKVLGIKE